MKRSTRARRALLVAAAAAPLAACTAKLDTDSVRRLFDEADRAFLKGDVNAVCDLRTKDFRLDSTYFVLARDRIVADRAEADAFEADDAAGGLRNTGKRETADHRQFCMLAFEGRDLARGSRLERGPLDVSVDPSGERATVRVHYVVVQPEYAVGDSAHGGRDETRQQVASRRTESDEESVVVRDGGDLRIASTRVTSWTFLVPAVRDARL